MNCKQGDMAEILTGPNRGGIVTCERQAVGASAYYGEFYWATKAAWPLLVIDGNDRGQYHTEASAPDSKLRPIRPDAEPVTNDVVAEVGA